MTTDGTHTTPGLTLADKVAERLAALEAQLEKESAAAKMFEEQSVLLQDQLAEVMKERDALRADLRAVAEVLRSIRYTSPSWSIDFAVCEEALARPGVQAVLREGNDHD